MQWSAGALMAWCGLVGEITESYFYMKKQKTLKNLRCLFGTRWLLVSVFEATNITLHLHLKNLRSLAILTLVK